MVYTEDDEKMKRHCVQARTGQTIILSGGRGILIEEAYAELQAANYARYELGRPNGVWDVPESGRMVSVGGSEMVPIVYAYPEGGSRVGMTVGALPAYGLELLIDVQPELEDALDAARTSTEGRRRVAREINAVQAGLYHTLTSIIDVTPTHFNEGLKVTKRAVGR